MEKTVLFKVKDDNLTYKVYEDFNDEEVQFIRTHQNHLCTSCDNFFNCDKVMDINKKRISHYKFIKEGLQIYRKCKKSNGEEEIDMSNFIVSKCVNYIKSCREDDPVKRRELMDSIFTNYYDTETYDEAVDIMISDNKKGFSYFIEQRTGTRHLR